MSDTEDVIFEVRNGVGFITLKRVYRVYDGLA